MGFQRCRERYLEEEAQPLQSCFTHPIKSVYKVVDPGIAHQIGIKGERGKKPSFVVVDASVNVTRDEKRKFGRHDKKYVLLPYHQELSLYLDHHLEHIKHGLLISAIVNENRPALRNYIHALKKFVDAHGFRFVKEDHLKFIKLMYLIMIKKDQWHDVVHYAAKALEKLIK
ncbi:unnamed protein product [Strongylus vulgaris]|uniref:Uncharacterized protein n=1 Tax=Strongylus vulgaris TaxID=40348 RepID=A0A3P7IG46_STRVU|nr:unnamed protein product [Strongylus vulgaris]